MAMLKVSATFPHGMDALAQENYDESQVKYSFFV